MERQTLTKNQSGLSAGDQPPASPVKLGNVLVVVVVSIAIKISLYYWYHYVGQHKFLNNNNHLMLLCFYPYLPGGKCYLLQLID